MFLGYALQAVGLLFTAATKSGFLLYLNVKFVPFFAFILYGRKIGLDIWISALAAFAGTLMLSIDPNNASLPNVGDLLSIAAAMASAMFILRLGTAAEQIPESRSKELNSAILWCVTGFCFLWFIGELFWDNYQHYSSELNSSNQIVDNTELFFSSLRTIVTQKIDLIRGPLSEDGKRNLWDGILPSTLYLSIIATALTNWIQTLGQRYIRAERASIIYSMDPVYGAVFSRLLLGPGEILGPLAIAGASLVTGAAVISNILSMRETK